MPASLRRDAGFGLRAGNGLNSPKILTLTTDFGLRDSYVGQMKGAVLAVDRDIRVVDLCHEVPPQQIRAGAYVLETGYAAFPAGSVHVAVVDPGVGTERRPLAVRAGSHLFVAPDNGLLTRVLDREPLLEAHVIEEESYLRPDRSATFEGRDLFAPAAAWLARGVELRDLGPPAGEIVRLPAAETHLRRGVPAEVPVLHVDRFGNVALDLRVEALDELLGGPPDSGTPCRLITPGGEVTAFRRTFGDAPGSDPFLLLNSAGYLEIALKNGKANVVLDLAPGARPVLTIGRRGE